jgi:hypothetical protein
MARALLSASRAIGGVMGIWKLSGLFLVVTGVGCLPDGDPPPDDQPIPQRTTFEFRPLDAPVPLARWGASVVEQGEGKAILLGGVADQVLKQVISVETDGDGIQFQEISEAPQAKYCGCPLFDSNRNEVIFMGGRDGQFRDAEVGHLLDVDSGEWVQLEDSPAFDYPVGCQAFFDPVHDRGYVFGGLSGSRGGFGDVTYRYEPDTRTFVALDITGPVPRYDGAFRPATPGGPILLVGGMGRAGALGGVAFFSDVWALDPENETWTEIPTTSTTIPGGRRYPWLTFAGDNKSFLYGFGSNSPMGTTVLGDLWRFNLEDKTWTEVELDGDKPVARGFTWWLPGPEGSVGALYAGFDGTNTVDDIFVLYAPTVEENGWH